MLCVTGIGFGGTACVGAAAAFGVAGCGSGGFNGFVEGSTTHDTPVVTLVSSVTVPEPSTWGMMLTGFAAIAFAGFRRAAKDRAVAGRAR
jgi:hypothetical protein